MSANLQPFSSAGGFVTSGDITTAAYASPAPNISGFTTINATTLVTNSGNIDGGTPTVVTDGINAIYTGATTTMDVYGFPFDQTTRGQLTISGDIDPTQALGTWYYQSTSTNAFEIFTDNTYTTPVDSTGWGAYGGGGSVAITKQLPAANIILNSNGYLSIFDTTGNVLLPNNLSVIGGEIILTGEGVIRSNSDTVSIQSYDVANSIGYGLRVGTTGGLYLEQGSDPTWLTFNPNAGNAEIYSAPGVSGGAGHSISIAAGPADQGSYNTNAGGNINIVGGLGGSDDGGGGGPGGSVNISSGLSADVAGHAGNVNIRTGDNTWTFDYTGDLTAPNNVSATGTITSLGNTNATAFAVVGSGAVSNVALGFFPPAGTPAQMSIRDYSTANSTMYFDTTIGSANIGGSFQFRGSNAFTAYANINQHGVQTPTTPAFRVYGNGVTSALNTTTNGTGILNGNNWAVDYNQGSYLNSTTGVFTAPVAGLYQVNLVARVANNTAGASQAIVVKNNATTPVNQVMWEVAANCTTNHFGVGTTSKLAVGDTLTLKVTQGNVTFDVNDNWSVAFLG